MEKELEKAIIELERQIKYEDFSCDNSSDIESDNLTKLRKKREGLVKERWEIKYNETSEKSERQEKKEVRKLNHKIAIADFDINNELSEIIRAKTKVSKIETKKKLNELKKKLKEVQDSNGTSKTLIENFKSIIKNKIFSAKKRTVNKKVEFKRKQKTNFDLRKISIWDIVFLLVVLWFSITIYKDITIKEYNLIVNKKIVTIGKIIKIEEFEEDVDGSETGQGSGIVYHYASTYTFNNNGKEIKGVSLTTGEPPFNMDLEDVPYEIKVEYLSKNPKKFNRIKGLRNDVTTLFRWFTRRILLRVIAILFVIFIIYKKQTDIDFFK